MSSRTYFNGHKQVPWYESPWLWVAMVSNWAFEEDIKKDRLVVEGYEGSLYLAYERWTTPSFCPGGEIQAVSSREVVEGFKELIGL